MAEDKSRSIEEITKVLHLAKLKEEDVMPTSQALYCTEENFHTNDYTLLQLDQHLLEEINVGKTLYMKGEDDESVVLCSDSRTYDIAVAETSNSLLLVNNLKYPNEVKGKEDRNCHNPIVHRIFYEYLEAVPSKPHLLKLQELLQQSIYTGPEHESEIDPRTLLTYEDLVTRIQASEKELKQALSEMDVVTVDDKIRLLDFEYHFRALSYMLKVIEENSWEPNEVDYQETLDCLEGVVPREIVDSLFDKYTVDSDICDPYQLYRYKEREVCQFFAKVLLHNAGKFNLVDFLQAWRESVPEGMSPDLDMLYGIAIVDRRTYPNVIWAFPEEYLPENINERLNALFNAKDKWTVPEIAPYMRRLTTDKLDTNALLAKYARASKIDGVTYYSAKHGK